MSNDIKTGAFGWPLAPSKRFPGEMTLACPACGSTNVTMGVQYSPRGTGSRGQGRLGDPGSTDFIACNDCRKSDFRPAKRML